MKHHLPLFLLGGKWLNKLYGNVRKAKISDLKGTTMRFHQRKLWLFPTVIEDLANFLPTKTKTYFGAHKNTDSSQKWMLQTNRCIQSQNLLRYSPVPAEYHESTIPYCALLILCGLLLRIYMRLIFSVQSTQAWSKRFSSLLTKSDEVETVLLS